MSLQYVRYPGHDHVIPRKFDDVLSELVNRSCIIINANAEDKSWGSYQPCVDKCKAAGLEIFLADEPRHGNLSVSFSFCYNNYDDKLVERHVYLSRSKVGAMFITNTCFCCHETEFARSIEAWHKYADDFHIVLAPTATGPALSHDRLKRQLGEIENLLLRTHDDGSISRPDLSGKILYV
jgi:hypothetical protein